MLKVQIWDKISPINGYPADKFWNENKDFFLNGDVILVYKEDTVIYTESAIRLKNMFNFADNLTSLEIGEAYLEEIKKNQEISNSETEQMQEEQITMEKLQAKIKEQEDALVEIANLLGGN